MKLGTLAYTLLMLSSAGALAATAPAGGRLVALDETVMALEARFPGKVVAIALDDSGDKAAHYHVDMRFPQSGLARVDVDAANLEISGREPVTSPAWPIGMIHAVARITSAVEGPLLAAALDTANGAPAHYDVDVGLPDGWIARLKVDAASGQIGWRTPAVVSE